MNLTSVEVDKKHWTKESLTQLGKYSDEWINAIRKDGFDGVITAYEYEIFDPNQIKSIYDNGKFSTISNNIYE